MKKLRCLFVSLAASLLFTGCSKDDDALGSLSEISVSQTYLCIAAEGGEAKTTIQTNADWKMRDIRLNPETGKTQYFSKVDATTGDSIFKDLWCSISQVSGGAGSADIIFKADATNGGREQEIIIEVGGKLQHINVRQGSFDAETVTCAFLNEQGLDGKIYRIKGIVTAIANTTYGNMYVTDATGTAYIYGTLDKDGAEKNFTSWGIEVGDEVVVEGPRVTNGTTIELSNVSVISISKSLLKLIETDPKEKLSREGGDVQFTLAYKGDGVYFTIPEEYQNMVAYKNYQYIAGIPSKLESNPADTLIYTFTVAANEGKAREASIRFVSSDGSNTSEQVVKIEQKGAVENVTIADFKSKPAGTEVFRLTGLVTRVDDAATGKYYISDYTGEIYVYKASGTVAVGDVVKDNDIQVGDKLTVVTTKSSDNVSNDEK